MDMNTHIGSPAFKNVYRCECFDSAGNLKWVEERENLVTNAGLDDVLDKYFKGSAYTASHFVGLKEAGAIAAGDTLASHVGWLENTAYTGNRQALTLGAVSGQSVDNSASQASFTFTGAATIAGVFIATVASGTVGVLYGAVDFGASRSVALNDVLNVTCTLTQASA